MFASCLDELKWWFSYDHSCVKDKFMQLGTCVSKSTKMLSHTQCLHPPLTKAATCRLINSQQLWLCVSSIDTLFIYT